MDERTLQLPELEAQGIKYRPMIWTCYGRPHADVISAMLRISKRAARRRGRTSERAVLTQLRLAVSVALARRAARMSLACWPHEVPAEKVVATAGEAVMQHFESNVEGDDEWEDDLAELTLLQLQRQVSNDL